MRTIKLIFVFSIIMSSTFAQNTADDSYNSGYIKYIRSDFKGSVDDLTKAITQKVKNIGEAYYYRGMAFIELKKYADALKDFSEEIKIEENIAGSAYCYRGYAKTFLKDPNGAMEDYNKAIQLEPKFAKPYQLRGDLQLVLGKNAEACADWKIALELGISEVEDNIKKNCGK